MWQTLKVTVAGTQSKSTPKQTSWQRVSYTVKRHGLYLSEILIVSKHEKQADYSAKPEVEICFKYYNWKIIVVSVRGAICSTEGNNIVCKSYSFLL